MPISVSLDIHRLLVQRTAGGNVADFAAAGGAGAAKPLISGVVVRNLLLGHAMPPALGGETFPPLPVHVRGAVIDGLNLADARASDGGGCRAIIFENCEFVNLAATDSPVRDLDARYASLGRVSLVNCALSCLDMSGSELAGDLELNGLHARTNDVCWVRCVGTTIRGSFRALGAKLAAPAEPVTLGALREYALDLNESRVAGSVLLRLGFSATGGIGLRNAKIDGDLWADGALLIAHEQTALFAQHAEIRGAVVLRAHTEADSAGGPRAFESDGTLQFYQASMGTLDLTGATLRPRGDQSLVLSAHLATIRGDVLLQSVDTGQFAFRFDAGGDIAFSQADIKGALTTNDAKIKSIHAAGVRIGGDVTLHGVVHGRADFRGARLSANLSLGAEGLQQPSLACLYRDSDKAADRISFEDATIANDLKIIGLEVRPDPVSVLAAAPTKLAPQGPPVLVRLARLRCYSGWFLGEALYCVPGRENFIVSFMIDAHAGTRKHRIVLLPGRSDAIHNFNSRHGLALDTDEQAKDYLRFFCAHIWGSSGAFLVVETPEDLIQGQPRPKRLSELQVSRQADGGWNASAMIAHADYLFECKFSIKRNGMVHMSEDLPVDNLPLPSWLIYEPPMRRIAIDGIMLINGKYVRTWPTPPPMPNSPWTDATGLQLSAASEALPELLREELVRTPGAKAARAAMHMIVNLKGASAGALDDDHGRRWGQYVRLKLDGFTYDRLDDTTLGGETSSSFGRASMSATSLAKRDAIGSSRIRWLKLQHYSQPDGLGGEFTPQPFEHAARVLRSAGHSDAADLVTLERKRIDRRAWEQAIIRRCRIHWSIRAKIRHIWEAKPKGKLAIAGTAMVLAVVLALALPYFAVVSVLGTVAIGGWRLYESAFLYGLSISRACITFLICLAIGIVGTDIFNYGYVRFPPIGAESRPAPAWVPEFLRFAPMGKPVLVVDTTPVSTLVARAVNHSGAVDKPASQRVSNPAMTVDEIPCGDQVESVLYALDVFVPLLDLQQERRCAISSREDAWVWRLAKSAYAVLGALVTSLTILTVSGILRRTVERAN